MRILQINASYKPAIIYGGPTMSVSMLSEQLVKAGVNCKVFTTTANGPTELPVAIGTPVNVDGVWVTYFKRITKDHTHFSPSLLLALWQQIKQYNVVHIHAWWNTVSILSGLIAVLRRVPVVVSPRGTLSNYSFHNKNKWIKNAIHQLLSKPILNRCYIHVTSGREEEAIGNLIDPKSITTIPNFVKLPSMAISTDAIVGDTLKLLFFSRIEEKKGLDILFNALKNVTIPYTLTIAGNGDVGYIEHLKQIAINNNIADKITWAGFYSDNKFDLLREHDLFILPSHDENFANAVIESLSTGTAVLISNKVGLFDYVQQKKLGWICDTDPNSISFIINTIGTQQLGELTRIRKDAPAIIYNDIAPEKLVENYLALYNSIAHE